MNNLKLGDKVELVGLEVNGVVEEILHSLHRDTRYCVNYEDEVLRASQLWLKREEIKKID